MPKKLHCNEEYLTNHMQDTSKSSRSRSQSRTRAFSAGPKKTKNSSILSPLSNKKPTSRNVQSQTIKKPINKKIASPKVFPLQENRQMQNMLTAYLKEKYPTSPIDENPSIKLQQSPPQQAFEINEVINLKQEVRKLHGDICKKDDEINVNLVSRNNYRK